jgi:hypothetical protein
MQDLVTLHAWLPRDGFNAQCDSPRLEISATTPLKPVAVTPGGSWMPNLKASLTRAGARRKIRLRSD